MQLNLTNFSTRFDNVIVFIIGGCTYEESLFVNNINIKRVTNNSQLRAILCSNYVHNAKRYLFCFLIILIIIKFIKKHFISY